MKSKLEQYSEWMKTFENEIVSFRNSIWNDNVETVRALTLGFMANGWLNVWMVPEPLHIASYMIMNNLNM